MNKQQIDNRAKTRSNHQSPEFIIESVTKLGNRIVFTYFHHVGPMHATSGAVVNKQLRFKRGAIGQSVPAKQCCHAQRDRRTIPERVPTSTPPVGTVLLILE